MTKEVVFRFYAELNDFLPPEKRQRDFRYAFFGRPTVKDAIEALGAPHPEVDLILVNNRSVDFAYHLQTGNRIAVYPVFELLNIENITHLRPRPLRQTRFIVDVNLGKLARKLRLLGFDAVYDRAAKDRRIINKALAERRIILTRSMGLLKHGAVTHGYWVRSAKPVQQTIEVLCRFDLFSQIKALSRCISCNELLQAVKKEEILEQIPERTHQVFDTFYRCPSCGKIYWAGSHYQKMLRFVQQIQDLAGACSSA